MGRLGAAVRADAVAARAGSDSTHAAAAGAAILTTTCSATCTSSLHHPILLPIAIPSRVFGDAVRDQPAARQTERVRLR